MKNVKNLINSALDEYESEGIPLEETFLDESLFLEEDLERFVPLSGHCLDSIFANDETLKKRKMDKEIGVFNPPKFTAGEHRALYGVFKIYNKRGFNLFTFTKGVWTTPYEICEAMEYKRDNRNAFNGRVIAEAKKFLRSLAYKNVDLYIRKYTGYDKKEKKRIFEVSVLVGTKILEYDYKAEEVKENEFTRESKVGRKAKKIHLKIRPELFSKNYFKLASGSFYTELSEKLKEKGKIVTEYHWLFMLWLLKQNRQKIEIEDDKLIKILKIYTDNRHMPRAREILKNLYKDFKDINYLDYAINVKAKTGGKKDVLILNPKKFRSLEKRLEKQKGKKIGYSQN